MSKHVIRTAESLDDLRRIIEEYETKDYEVAGLTKDVDDFVVVFKKNDWGIWEYLRKSLEEPLEQQRDGYWWQYPHISCGERLL